MKIQKRLSLLLITIHFGLYGIQAIADRHNEVMFVPTGSYSLSVPAQNVVLDDGTEGKIQANITLCPNNQADGLVKIELADGAPFTLTPISAIHSGVPATDPLKAAIVYLTEAEDEAVFRVGTIDTSPQADSPNNNEDAWYFGAGFEFSPSPEKPLHFQVKQTVIQVTDQQCMRHDYGQLPVAVKLRTPPKTVFPEDSDPLKFAAIINIEPNQKANGFGFFGFESGESSQQDLVSPFFGAVFEHSIQKTLFSVGVNEEGFDSVYV